MKRAGYRRESVVGAPLKRSGRFAIFSETGCVFSPDRAEGRPVDSRRIWPRRRLSKLALWTARNFAAGCGPRGAALFSARTD
jgi:hypothetical protein